MTINFETSHFANGLTLTENVARCIVNRLLNASEVEADNYLPYLAYYPEYEPFVAAPGEARDARVADLAEQPGEGCGVAAQPITGDVCPQCAGQGPFWPAAPYGDAEHGATLGQAGAEAKCSHCLMPQVGGGRLVYCGADGARRSSVHGASSPARRLRQPDRQSIRQLHSALPQAETLCELPPEMSALY